MTASSQRKTVLFLGSGATAGSGLCRDDQTLPTDGGFFGSALVERQLATGGFPALCLVREQPGLLAERSLFRTWNGLFVYRGLARAGVIRSSAEVIARFDRLGNYDWLSGFDRKQEHYQHQFTIMRSELPREYYLAELAIWDLRVLVKHVYNGDLGPSHAYCDLLQSLRGSARLSAVVNLNYDTTFDDAFRDQFYHPGDAEVPAAGRWPLIRPHGSLKWTSRGVWSLRKGNWQGWTHEWTGIGQWRLGYRKINEGELELCQPLIVSPAESKEEVVGNSSLPGLQNHILRQQWVALEAVLAESNCWVFIGLSLASGDDHLVFLLRRALQRKNMIQVHCSCYDNDHVCEKLGSELNIPVCCHPIPKCRTILEFVTPVKSRESCPFRRRLPDSG